MGDIRSIKAAARAAVHERASRPVYVFLDRASLVFDERAARVHRQAATHGGLQGTSFHYAEMETTDAKIVFASSDAVGITRGVIIMVDSGEGYEVDRSLVPDGGYTTFAVTPLTKVEADGRPYPPVE